MCVCFEFVRLYECMRVCAYVCMGGGGGAVVVVVCFLEGDVLLFAVVLTKVP